MSLNFYGRETEIAILYGCAVGAGLGRRRVPNAIDMAARSSDQPANLQLPLSRDHL